MAVSTLGSIGVRHAVVDIVLGVPCRLCQWQAPYSVYPLTCGKATVSALKEKPEEHFNNCGTECNNVINNI